MNILRKFTPCKKQYSTSSLNRNIFLMWILFIPSVILNFIIGLTFCNLFGFFRCILPIKSQPHR